MIVLIKLIKIKLITNSNSLIGEIKRFVRFLDHISSRKDIVRPNCPLNNISHSTTADKIILRTPNPLYESFEIKKFVKNPQNKIWTDGQ